VPVAAASCASLRLPLDVAPVSKVLLPWTTESGYGAVAFDGSVWLDEAAIERFGLAPAQIEKATAEARAKVERRRALLRMGKLDFARRTVILVDDGIAAGSTMRTAIAALRRQAAGKVVVAVPTAHASAFAAITKLADDAQCADVRSGPRFAVADAYEEWRDLSDDEIAAMLENFKW
jgi:putative phosphoribosyl transferase